MSWISRAIRCRSSSTPASRAWASSWACRPAFSCQRRGQLPVGLVQLGDDLTTALTLARLEYPEQGEAATDRRVDRSEPDQPENRGRRGDGDEPAADLGVRDHHGGHDYADVSPAAAQVRDRVEVAGNGLEPYSGDWNTSAAINPSSPTT